MRPTAEQLDAERQKMGLPPVSEQMFVPEGSAVEVAANPPRWKKTVARSAAYASPLIFVLLVAFFTAECGKVPDATVPYPQIPPKLGCYIAGLFWWAILLTPTALIAFLFRRFASRFEKILSWLFCFIPLVFLGFLSYEVFR